MIAVGVVLAVIMAKLRGGKLERLHDLGLKGLPWVILALLLRLLVRVLAVRAIDMAWLQIVAYLLLFYALLQNLQLPGLKLFTAGSCLNFLVIAINGGTMPVSAVAMSFANLQGDPAGTHNLLTATTRLFFLADIIPLRPPYFPVAEVISMGDIFIVAGIFYFIQRKMLTPA
ncbi:MAG TPA: DUF5317 domain-containing protein [Oscillospiraceae bacterium]|nr:DUF5317 domain-containing protein [Oscillospiraceae bacterium]